MENEQTDLVPGTAINRRKFITKATTTIGAAVLLASPLLSRADSFFNIDEPVSVGDVMDLFIKQIPGAPFKGTVDTLKSGNRDIKVTGIVTTMFATIDVIRRAIELGANFIIAHEPTFYNHQDDTNWLADDPVYQYKADLLSKHNIAVWRNHDYIHSLALDGVRTGLLAQLGWERYYDPLNKSLMTLPPASLKDIIKRTKAKLNIQEVRYIGDLNQPCKKILLMPGASGGRSHITGIIKHQPDVLICGEIQEWETAEYVRDAIAKGQKLALIVLGHIASEEPGSEFMQGWLKKNLPAIKATHVRSGNSLSFL